MILSDQKLEWTPINQVYRAYWYNLCEGSNKQNCGDTIFLTDF